MVNRKQDKTYEETGSPGPVSLSWLQRYVLPKLIEEYGTYPEEDIIEIFYDVVEELRENGTVSGI